MTEKVNSMFQEVNVDQLEEGMTIVAYTGFSVEFSKMSSANCRFVRHNFKNTTTVVIRKNKRLKIPVTEIAEGDRLIKISNFPPELEKITRVSAQFADELKKRRMYRFIVKRENRLSSSVKKDLRDIIDQVAKTTGHPTRQKPTPRQRQKRNTVGGINNFIAQVAEGLEIRDQATMAVKSTMDRARKGFLDIREIKSNLNSINGSAEAMTAIVSLKESEWTYEHCVDVGVIFKTVYGKGLKEINHRSAFESEEEAMLSGFLHDIGKAKIPKYILEHSNPLEPSGREIQIIRSHPALGAILLEELNMSQTAVNMARYHHVKQETSMLNSYPQNAVWKQVAFETRLLAIIDIYQSLVGRRKYKRSWPASAAMKYLDALSGVEYDRQAWDVFSKVMGMYPAGSLVRLNDGSTGFVMNSPENSRKADRPLVVVTKNQNGEELTHPDVIDLQKETEFSIAKDLDYKTEYGSRTIDVFTNLRVA